MLGMTLNAAKKKQKNMKSAFKALTTEIVNSIFVLLSVFLRLFIADPARGQAFDHLKDPCEIQNDIYFLFPLLPFPELRFSRNQGVWWRVAAGQEEVEVEGT